MQRRASSGSERARTPWRALSRAHARGQSPPRTLTYPGARDISTSLLSKSTPSLAASVAVTALLLAGCRSREQAPAPRRATPDAAPVAAAVPAAAATKPALLAGQRTVLDLFANRVHAVVH